MEDITKFYNEVHNKVGNENVKVIFDIGSRDALESVEFSKRFPNTKIYAFEANPTSYKNCLTNAQEIDRIVVINTVVNDFDGFCKFYPINTQKTITTHADGNPGASSMFLSNGAADHIEKYVQDEIEMPCTRLDTFCKKHNITSVDAIWMDLQGAELLALKSLGELLDTVQVIETELEINPMYTGQYLFEETNQFLISKGFKMISGNLAVHFGTNVIYSRE
jgi:FkbM family methyltransferase